MVIYVNRIVKVNQPLPSAPENVLNLNCLNFFPNNIQDGIPLYEIVPYNIRSYIRKYLARIQSIS